MPLQTSVPVKIGEQTFNVNYPLVGEKFKIENNKLLLTNGQYGDLSRSAHATALYYLDTVDAFSYFAVLIPELKLDLDKFNSMNAVQELELRTAYLENYLPFFLETEKIVRGEKKDEPAASK